MAATDDATKALEMADKGAALTPDNLAPPLDVPRPGQRNVGVPLVPGDPDFPFPRSPMASQKQGSGGVVHDDEQEMARQRAVLFQMIKKLGNSLFTASNILTTSAPVALFDPEGSFLTRAATAWSFPHFMTKAAAATDPVERLKWTATFYLAGLHAGCSNLKPFNPILGETWEADLADGSKLYMEQVSHHPPCSAWEVVGVNNAWTLQGHGVLWGAWRGNHAKGGRKDGSDTIKFADGTFYKITVPNALIKGVLWGERAIDYSDKLVIEDEANGLKLDVSFNPAGKSWMPSMFSSKKRPPSDQVKGTICKGKKVLSSLDGTWLGSVAFDGTTYWSIEDHNVHSPVLPKKPLPSDSRFRHDIAWIRQGQVDKAQESKDELEKRQRNDAKLRKGSAVPRADEDVPEFPLPFPDNAQSLHGDDGSMDQCPPS